MLEHVKVTISDLEVGMYVSRLDRPWLETPFLLQGFRVETEKDINRLNKYCRHVYIDTRKSDSQPDPLRQTLQRQPRRTAAELFTKRTIRSYEDDSTWEQEYPAAQKAVQDLSAGIDGVFDQISNGAPVDVLKVKKAVDPMIDSVVRNPDACIWLARMKQEDQYTYQHSLGASIWAVALGRQLGLPRSDLRSLAVGGLLFDVGKLALDRELLNTDRPLTDEEFQLVRDHVRHGLRMIEESHLMNQDVIDMVAHHHERHDGSGYPKGLAGDEIPVFARIAAIVDCYDAVTSPRTYAKAISPSEAIKLLYDWKDVEFQAELVESFIQAIGIYPAGSLVELSSGEVAVVVSEYRTRRLRPKVMVLLDKNKQPLSNARIIDLLSEEHTDAGEHLEIVKSLEPDAYGIQMAGIQL